MSHEKGPSGKKKGGKYTATSLYITVPTLMAAAILIGLFAGHWADGYFGTKPYLTLVGLALGFGAAGREIYMLVKKVQSIQEEEDSK